MTLLDYIAFFTFVFSLVGLGFFSKKALSEASFLVADRSASLFALTATLVMTEFNSATLISFTSVGYGVGFWALTLPCVFLIGLLFYAATVAKKWKEFDGLSVAGFFTQKYGSDLGKLASGSLILAMLGFSATYIKSLYLLFVPLFPIDNQWLITSFLVSLVLLMTLRGGLFSVITTDIVSFIALITLFPLIAYFSWLAPVTQEVVISLPEAMQALPPHFLISLVALTMFTYILAPWYGQKIFAAKSKKVAYQSVIIAAILVCLLYGMAVFSTSMLKYQGVVSSADGAFSALLQLNLPQGVRGLSYGLLFAITATTMTGVWSAMTAMVIADFLGEGGDSRRGRLITIGFALLCTFLANTMVDRVFDKLILANIPILALSFALLAGFYWKGVTRLGAYLSIAVGFLWGVAAYLYWGEAGGYTWYWTIYGIPLSFVSGALGSMKKRLILSYKS